MSVWASETVSLHFFESGGAISVQRSGIDVASSRNTKELYMSRFTSLACLLAVVACSKHEREPDMAPASRVSPPTARSIERITTARCAREAKCDNIGADRKYSSREDCNSRIKDAAYAALGPPRCKKGVNQDQLNECLAAIEDEECGEVVDTIERVIDCRSIVLCAD